MKKTKRRQRSGVGLANKLIIRPNPFSLSRDKQTDGVPVRRYRYGESIVVVHGGKLFEEDRGTLLLFLELSKQNNHKPFDFALTDIAKAKGVKNPYAESVLEPIRESIDRLLDAQIRIRPANKKKGLTAKFILIEGWLDSDDTGNISVSPYLEIIRDLALGITYIQPGLYFSLKSQIARSLYVFLSSQRPFYDREGDGYSIRLSRLVEYLNYERGERPWWRIWRHVERAIEELKKVGLIGKYQRDKNRHRKDGGVLTFWPAEKEKQVAGAAKSSGKNKHAAALDSIKKAFPKATWSDAGLIAALDEAEAFLEPYTTSLGIFVKKYVRWLGQSQNLRFHAPSLFRPDNSFFQEFVSIQVEDAMLITKKKAEAAEKRRVREIERDKEYERKFGKEKKVNKGTCPYGHKFGFDWDQHLDDCEECEVEVRAECAEAHQ